MSINFRYKEVCHIELWQSREKAQLFHQAWKGLNDN
jgi:hypothetical protein